MISNGSVNHVQILGRLGADPELKHTANGSALCSLSVATSQTWVDKNSGEKQEKTEWHRVTLWNKIAEIAAQYTQKGSRVMIEGMLQTRSYTDRDGATKYITEIKAESLLLLDSAKKPGQGSAPEDGPETREQPPEPESPNSHAGSEVDPDDDLPF